MYLDILAADNFIQVNKKLIKIVGINAATYWAELMNVFRKVCKKKTFDERAFFKLDRDYITEQTSLSAADQYKCDIILTSVGILMEDENDPNKIAVDIEGAVAIITNEDLDALKSLQKSAKPKRGDTAIAKKNSIIKNLKNGINESNPDIRLALERWIEAMMQKSMLSKAQVQIFSEFASKYSSDPAVIKQVIDIATLHGYRDFSWAVNIYEKDYRGKNSVMLGSQKNGAAIGVSNETF